MMIDTQQVFEERMRKFRKTIKQYQQSEVRTIKQKSQEEQQYQHAKIIKENKEYYENAFQKKFKGVQVQLKIQKSRKINQMRMSKMKLRFQMIEKIQQDIKAKLLKTLENPVTYQELLRKLMIQGMIKLLQQKIEVQCLRRDVKIVKSVAQKCQREFGQMCSLKSTLTVNQNHSLSDSQLGGIVLTSYKGRIVCNNTLRVRLEYALQLFLPQVRKQLFENERK